MKKLKIVIVDYEMGNVRSIENAVKHVGDFDIEISSSSDAIDNADCLILPGVGAFPDAMRKLSEKGLVSILNDAVKIKKKPTLGICLGMQLLFESSDEKKLTKGLGWIPGSVVYMKPDKNLRIPHIGWNSINVSANDSMFGFLNYDKDFYFVHSLHAQCEEKYVLAKFNYGGEMTAAVKNENVVGMQFHPEKSQKNGLAALHSFFQWAQICIGHKHA